MNKKKYKLTFTMTGKELKSFTTNGDFLDDDKLYRLTWELTGFFNYLRGWWGIIRRAPHSFEFEERP